MPVVALVGSVLLAEVVAAGVVAAAVVAAGVPVAAPCACNAETNFWMKACMACCGVRVVDEDVLLLDALAEPAAMELVAVASVVVAAVPAAEVAAVVVVSAPDCVRACIRASNRPPAGGVLVGLGVAPGNALVALLPELWDALPIRLTGYC